MKNIQYLLGILLFIVFTSCKNDDNTTVDFKFPALGEGQELPFIVLTTLPNDTEVRNGGFGSAMVAHPTMEGHFYCLTDRGPNTNFLGAKGNGKKFPVPGYSPRIGHFKLNSDGAVELVAEIVLKNPAGQPITGLPNPEGLGATGEIPYDNEGNALAFDEYGLDGEGLVALPNGEFWVADEYGPHIVHYTAEGIELERISPLHIHTTGRKLPAVLERRRPNRGMEGLTITPDGSILVGIMQSTLYNPSKDDVVNKTLTRIVSFNLSTGETKQYLYRQEKDWNANSEITALSNTSFLIVERDGKFSGAEEAQKHIYRIDLANATDVSGDFTAIDGETFEGNTLEQMTWEEINAQGINTVSKTLVADLVAILPNNYPHDKLEGIWLIDNTRIGVINDDDFAITAEGEEIVQKIVPGVNTIDSNTLYIINIGL